MTSAINPTMPRNIPAVIASAMDHISTAPFSRTSCSAVNMRGCYEPPIKLSSLGSKRQAKATKCNPIKVVGSRS